MDIEGNLVMFFQSFFGDYTQNRFGEGGVSYGLTKSLALSVDTMLKARLMQLDLEGSCLTITYVNNH